MFKQNILYKDDDFFVYKPLIYEELLVIPRGEKFYDNVKELPKYIKEIIIKEKI